jgi:predicted RNase H-like HicB family nuclease
MIFSGSYHNYSLWGGRAMPKLTVIYWKAEKYYLGKILEHPEIMTQGETLEELFENIRDAYSLILFDEVPDNYEIKEISL